MGEEVKRKGVWNKGIFEYKIKEFGRYFVFLMYVGRNLRFLNMGIFFKGRLFR